MLSHCLHFCGRYRSTYIIITSYSGDCATLALYQYPEFRSVGIPQKKTEVRCSSRGEARQTSGAPSAAAGLINRSRDWAGSTNQLRGSATKIGGRLPPARRGKPREEEERSTDVFFYRKKERKAEEGTRGGGGGGGGRGRWCRGEMKVHFFLGSKVSSRRGGRGPPPCSPAATGSHPPVPYVIRVTYVCACVSACATHVRAHAGGSGGRRTPLRY